MTGHGLTNTNSTLSVSNSAEAYFLRGFMMHTNGQLNAAMIDYTHCIQIDPKFYAAYRNRGILKLHEGDLSGAIADFTKAIQLTNTCDLFTIEV